MSAVELPFRKDLDTIPGFSIESDYLLKRIKLWGATLVGIGDVTEGLAREFRHLPNAISLAIAHPAIEECLRTKDGVVAYSNQFPEIDVLLESIEKRIESYLRSRGWKAFAIPPDSDKQDPRFVAKLFPLFPHKTAATCAGLGWVGKNGLLVTRQYGARLSWATVLTDAPLEVSGKPFFSGQCNGCNSCVKICPAGAISSEEWIRGYNTPKINTSDCAQRLKDNNQILGSYICGLCITACPLSRK